MIDAETLMQKLAAADIAFARINDAAGLARHPHLHRITVQTPHGPVSYPAPVERDPTTPRQYGPVPGLGEHTEVVRAEFLATAIAAK
jgi:itaconate CoA-transferase